jgi:thiamine-phosphate diphosphorylase
VSGAPRLVIITDFAHRPETACRDRIEQACGGARPGSVMIQLRDHELSVRRRLELGRALVGVAHGHGQLFAVNDRLDLALLLEADGVHLAESSVAPSDARRLLPDAFISRACHEPTRCTLDGADAVVVSPIAAARHARPALGLGALAIARAAMGLSGSLIALGGVDADGAPALLQAGADAVAVMGAVLDVDPLPLLDALGLKR